MSALLKIEDDVFCFLNGAFFEAVMMSIETSDPAVAKTLEEAIAVNFLLLPFEETETRAKLRKLVHDRFEELLRRGVDDPIMKHHEGSWLRFYKEETEAVVHMLRTGTSPPPPYGPVRAK